jgi:hypothetical protein
MTDYIYDNFGRKYEIINSVKVKELSGDGGILSFSRSSVTITVNDTHVIDFALHTKPPAFLYINGKPALKNVLYMPARLADGYTYGIYFSELVYNFASNKGELSMVRTMTAMVAKCLAEL